MAIYKTMGTLSTPTGDEDIEFIFNVGDDGICHVRYNDGGTETPVPPEWMASWEEKDNMWSAVTREYSLPNTALRNSMAASDYNLQKSYSSFNNFKGTFADSGLKSDVLVCSYVYNRTSIYMEDTFANCDITGTYQLNSLHCNMNGVFKNTNLSEVNFNGCKIPGYYNMVHCFENCNNLNNIVIGTAAGAGQLWNLDYTFSNCPNVQRIYKTGGHNITSGNFAFSNVGKHAWDYGVLNLTLAQMCQGVWNINGSAVSMYDNCKAYLRRLTFNFSDMFNSQGQNMLRNAETACGSAAGDRGGTDQIWINNCNNLAYAFADGCSGKTVKDGSWGWYGADFRNCGNLYGFWTNWHTGCTGDNVADAGGWALATLCYNGYVTDLRHYFDNTYCHNDINWTYYPTIYLNPDGDATPELRNYPYYKDEARDAGNTWSAIRPYQPTRRKASWSADGSNKQKMFWPTNYSGGLGLVINAQDAMPGVDHGEMGPYWKNGSWGETTAHWYGGNRYYWWRNDYRDGTDAPNYTPLILWHR